jgi:hypothetical protein
LLCFDNSIQGRFIFPFRLKHFQSRIPKSASDAISSQIASLYVRTLAGSGIQGLNIVVGAQLTEHHRVVSTSLITESSALEESDRDALLIVMAGLHQVWALFLNETTQWKGKWVEIDSFLFYHFSIKHIH